MTNILEQEAEVLKGEEFELIGLELFGSYIENAQKLANTKSLDVHELVFSEHAFSVAIRECTRDLKAFIGRRNPETGISPAKLAGIALFRLIRGDILSPRQSLIENPEAFDIHYQTAITVVFDVHLEIDPDDIPQSVMLELLYILRWRHYNQEMLGLVFETIYTMKNAN
ncbi:hypothetical protein [Magnetococcus sp. PR-3]|uniref:hypothetical protein n=1 Tax=Magnetococcus sp. PR-3 TaxID=3120355 RepID=UPI002FCE4F72